LKVYGITKKKVCGRNLKTVWYSNEANIARGLGYSLINYLAKLLGYGHGSL
jgi:hypothetical protein